MPLTPGDKLGPYEIVAPLSRLRSLSHQRICELARKVSLAMGCQPAPAQ